MLSVILVLNSFSYSDHPEVIRLSFGIQHFRISTSQALPLSGVYTQGELIIQEFYFRLEAAQNCNYTPIHNTTTEISTDIQSIYYRIKPHYL